MEKPPKYITDTPYNDLVNLLINLEQTKEDLWKYHPANKEKKDIVKDYFNVEKDIELIQKQLKTLEAEQKEWYDAH